MARNGEDDPAVVSFDAAASYHNFTTSPFSSPSRSPMVVSSFLALILNATLMTTMAASPAEAFAAVVSDVSRPRTAAAVAFVGSFLPPVPPSFSSCSCSCLSSLSSSSSSSSALSMGHKVSDELFGSDDDDSDDSDREEMMQIAANYVAAKYRLCASEHGSDVMTCGDAREVLRSILPPVTPDELDDEVTRMLGIIAARGEGGGAESSSDDGNVQGGNIAISEDCFVDAVLQNTYWRKAGGLVVKELMYFDALLHYYRTGISLLDDGDYMTLKDDLTWEGSSVVSMTKDEALFVSAVASARRGDAIMSDEEYGSLKDRLKGQKSWITARGKDALEKMGLNTFMGYLHRSL